MPGLPQPGDRFGRYLVVRRLGQGGMGVVYAARQDDLDREVALKLLSPHLTEAEGYAARFRREATALARLESAHVVQVHDAGDQDGWLYIATQLVPDGDLADLLSREGPVSPAAALALVDQVLAGLEDAHAARVLHRDIKPTNVLVRRTPTGLRLYLCDFGISQMVDSEHTLTQGVAGTYGYLAPERHLGEDASPASDVYSVGCVLWALLTGHAPYSGTGFRVALRHRDDPVPQLAGTGPDVELANQVLLRAMAKSPRDRYQTASEMRAAVQAGAAAGAGAEAAATVVKARPPAPRPPTAIGAGPSYAAPVPTRSRPAYVVPVAAACATLALAILAATGWLLLRDDPTATASGARGAASGSSIASASPTSTADPDPATATATSEPASTPTPTASPTTGEQGPGPVADLEPGLLCRDVEARDYSYVAAVEYWKQHGQPNEMDADRNGIPCETVYPASDVTAFWGDRAPEEPSDPAPDRGLLCRDLVDAGYTYPEAVDYWFGDGAPDRMDVDLNGRPCETVYPEADVTDYWGS